MVRRVLPSLMIALLALTATSFGQQVTRQDDGSWATGVIGLASSLSDATRLEILSASNLSGKLTVTAEEVEAVQVKYIKRAKTKSRSSGIDYIDLLSVVLDVLPDQTRLELRAPNPAPWAKYNDDAGIDVDVVVPLNWSLRVEATYYDVVAVGPFSSVEVPSSLGRLDISAVDGELDVTTANRRVTLEDITGTINVETSRSTLSGRSIRSLGEQARFRNEAGEIDLQDVAGAVNIRNDFGRISLSGFEPQGTSSLIRGSQAPISIELGRISEGLVVSNRNEDIDITLPDSASAILHLAVDDSGHIEASGFDFTTDMVQPTRLSLIAGDGAVDISGKIRGEGNIYVRGIRGQ